MTGKISTPDLHRGAGKYDELATLIRENERADGVILIVIGGDHRGGMAMHVPVSAAAEVPKMLRTLADDVEADLRHDPPVDPTLN